MMKVVIGLVIVALAGAFVFFLCEAVQFLKKADFFQSGQSLKILDFFKKIKAFFATRKDKVLKTLKKWYFLFRWFIIGRYHCDIIIKHKCSKKAFKAIRWALLFFIIYSCTMSMAGFIDALRPFFIKVFA